MLDLDVDAPSPLAQIIENTTIDAQRINNKYQHFIVICNKKVTNLTQNTSDLVLKDGC